jgi:hypothetical protein
MITAEDLASVLESLGALQRFSKRLGEHDLAFAYMTFPERAREELTKGLLIFAAQQLLLDPEPATSMAIHIALLRYLYPCQGDSPCVNCGLRADLAERMAAAGTFSPLAPMPPEHRAFALPPAEVIQPPAKTKAEHIAYLEALAAATGVINPHQPPVAVAVEPEPQLAEV